MDNFVKIYNKLITSKEFTDFKTGEVFHNDYWLTPDELYLYYFLGSLKSQTLMKTVTNVDVISHLVKFRKKEDQNKSYIWNLLKSIENKGVLKFKVNQNSDAKLSEWSEGISLINVNSVH